MWFLSLASLPFWEQLSCPRSLCYPPGTAASLKLLLFSPRAQSQEKELGVASRRALLGSLGQGFPALCFYWVSSSCDDEMLLVCFCFQHHLLAGSSERMAQLLFSCWVEQDCCHMLKVAVCPWRCMSWAAAVPFPRCQLQRAIKMVYLFISARFKAFLWPNSATLYCSSFETDKTELCWFNLCLLLHLLRVGLVTAIKWENFWLEATQRL